MIYIDVDGSFKAVIKVCLCLSVMFIEALQVFMKAAVSVGCKLSYYESVAL